MSFPVVLAGFSLIFGLGHSQVRQFERLAANDIRSKLNGDRMHVSVKTKLNGVLGGALGDLSMVTIRADAFETPALPLFTEPQLSHAGKVRTLRLELSDFTLAGLHCDRLEATIPDCRFDYNLALRHHQIRLSQSGTGDGLVRIAQKDLEAYILKKFREIKRVSVTITPKGITVEGYGEFLVISTNFSVEATLASPDGRTIELANCKILFDGRPAEAQASRVLLDTLNPVVDLPKDLKLLDAISVKGIRLGNGYLEAWGKTKIPVKPSASS
jgi:hypothetical protein